MNLNITRLEAFQNCKLEREALSNVVGGGRAWSKEEINDTWLIDNEGDFYHVRYIYQEKYALINYVHEETFLIPKIAVRDRNHLLAVCSSQAIERLKKKQ